MDSFIGQIRLFAGNYAPQDWALCNGASLAIQAYPALYSLIGVTYGGDGVTKFQLPNLQLVLPVGINTTATTTTSAYPLGATGGTFAVTLTEAQLPPHTHTLNVLTTPATQTVPQSGSMPAALPNGFTGYAKPVAGGTLVAMATTAPTAVSAVGGSQPHYNGMPVINMNYIICISGIYPNLS
ncbi:phage tail protein [Insolitispirillum peregrinum]|uniref:Microcystin-dependent protein n=1 Tax=Insolitispirillum peregrinum TaxID=80876 RepID=A0A1N7JF46_9PROT|nr:tail fiber protein [Insolitispirillum peregrinum]SIS47957.1 Microcystin-dependent protein [Insolitispirillum peregrinum]